MNEILIIVIGMASEFLKQLVNVFGCQSHILVREFIVLLGIVWLPLVSSVFELLFVLQECWVSELIGVPELVPCGRLVCSGYLSDHLLSDLQV